MTEKRKHVVVVGGGFGGLNAVLGLGGEAVDVTLIDRRNFHLFQPLLYQVATASLSPGDIASPLRAVVRKQKNVRVWLGEVESVDVERQTVLLKDGEVTYDYLIVATGGTHAYFGHEEWGAVAPGLKTVEDATEIRRRFLLAFENAERESDPAKRRQLLTFVIVGAGPTGVELAGAMAEIAHHTLPSDFRAIDTATARIILLEGGDRVLPTFAPELSEKARRSLESRGVEVRTGAFVTGIEPGRVTIGNEVIDACDLVWAAGVKASPLGATLGAVTDRAGRVEVNSDATIPGHANVFVIGDLALFREDGNPLPGVATVAIQQGKYVAKTIRRDLRGEPRKPFHYFDKGLLATIGKASAVADVGGLKMSGLLAWLIWVVIHISYLIGFRNRILVMIQWGWAWLTASRGIRLITGNAETMERAEETVFR
jgi:NADH dehydrogenase